MTRSERVALLIGDTDTRLRVLRGAMHKRQRPTASSDQVLARWLPVVVSGGVVRVLRQGW